MNKLFFAATLLISTVSMAQGMPPMGAPGNPGNQGAMGMEYAQNFQEHKAKELQRISQRMSELQTRQSCVQAAANPQALAACTPKERRF